MTYKECLCQPSKALIVLLSLAPLCPTKILENARILLANLLQSSRSTFSWGSFLSFFAFKEGMLGTPISVLGGREQYPPVFLTCLQTIHVCYGHRGVLAPVCLSLRRDASLSGGHRGYHHSSKCMEQAATSTPRAGARPPRFVPTAHARCAGSVPRPVPPRWRRSASASARQT